MKAVGICLLLLAATGSGVAAQTKKPVVKSKAGAASHALANGKKLYAVNCLTCHQADGSGVPNLNPPLINTQWVNGSKATLIQFVLKGSKGKVEIDGETFHNAMPAQAHLTDVQIADILTYVRKSFGNKAGAVTAADVKKVRAQTK